jgi:hypothetical protein
MIIYSPDQCTAQLGSIIDSIPSHVTPYATGVTTNGTYLWVTGSPNHYIYKLSMTGQLVDSIPDPASRVGDVSQGIVYAGNNLWTTCYLCDSLYRLNTVTKLVTGAYSGMNRDERVSIAFNGANKLYFANGSDQNGAYLFDIQSHSFTSWGSSVFARGFAYVNHQLFGTYFTSAPDQSHIFEADTISGNMVRMENWCIDDPFGGLGMTYDGTYLWQTTTNNSYIYKIAFSPLLNVSNPDYENDFSILSNPVHDQLNLSEGRMAITEIEIYDVIGKRIKKCKYFSGNSIDVSMFSAGIYFLKASDEGNKLSVIRKFIID